MTNNLLNLMKRPTSGARFWTRNQGENPSERTSSGNCCVFSIRLYSTSSLLLRVACNLQIVNTDLCVYPPVSSGYYPPDFDGGLAG